MNIIILEQARTDAVRKFDYQMAVALEYLLTEINECCQGYRHRIIAVVNWFGFTTNLLQTKA